MRKIYVGSDHAGFNLKDWIKTIIKKEGEIVDVGCNSEERCDYPDFAHEVAKGVLKEKGALGILICGSGNGIAIAANKHKGIRAAICWEGELAKLAREHNNANILVLPARFIENGEAKKCVELFLTTDFEGGRHEERVNKIDL